MEKLLLFLHLTAVVAAFGPALVFPLFGRDNPRVTAPRIVLALQRIVTPGLVGVLVFGGALTAASDTDMKMSEAWLSLAALAVVVALAVVWALLIPQQRKIAAARDDREAAALAKKAAGMMGILHLVMVVGLVLMVWRPGRG